MGEFATEELRRGLPTRASGSVVTFRRRRDLVGVEARTIELRETHSRSGFCSYSPDYEFLHSVTLQGEIWHRRRWLVAQTGQLMAARPGDVFVTRRVEAPGHCCSLILEATALSGYLREHQFCLERLRLPPCMTMSPELRRRFAAAINSLEPAASLLESQVSVAEFIATLLAELGGERGPESSRRSDAAHHAHARLQSDIAGEVDLETLAEETGLSRFQLLRIFKRRFGIPPHAYRMQVRIALARKLLRSGMTPAGVAAELGFVDQSHMTRHFKRAVGTTPAKYGTQNG